MDHQSKQQRWRYFRLVLLAFGGITVIPCGLLVLGTFLPGIPFLGLFGAWYLGQLAGQVLALAIIGTAFAFGALRLGVDRIGLVLTCIGLLSTVGAGIVLVGQAIIGIENGANINLLATVVPRSIRDGAYPDVTVAYTQADSQNLQIDIYQPNGTVRSLVPVVMYIHGGGWIWNDRKAQAANLRWFADQGYVAVSPDYSLATPGHPTWNTASAQVACALSWIAQNAAHYGGDPKRLFAYGDSSGGALILTTTYAAAADVAASSCGGEVPKVRAVAAQYPAVDPVTFYENPDPYLSDTARSAVSEYLGGSPSEYPERAKAVSSATYITPNAPPTLIFVNDSDHLVPVAGVLDFIHQAKQAGVSIRTITFPWSDHTVNLQYYSPSNQAILQIMLMYFRAYGG